jgi:hypothetical protein
LIDLAKEIIQNTVWKRGREERRKGGKERTQQVLTAENYPELMKGINAQIQEVPKS